MTIEIQNLDKNRLAEAARVCLQGLKRTPATDWLQTPSNAEQLLAGYLEQLLFPPTPTKTETGGWVAVDSATGQVQAVLAGYFYLLKPEDSMYSYMPPRYFLAPLPACQAVSDKAALEAFPLLLEAVREANRARQIQRIQLTVGVHNWVQGAVWRRLGFVPDSVMAGQPMAGWQASGRKIPDGLSVRDATANDLDALTDLALEEHLYHARHTDSGVSPDQPRQTAYRIAEEQIQRAPEAGQQLLAEYLAPGVAMPQPAGSLSSSFIELDESRVSRLWLPPNYGYIGLTSVSETVRGQGVGRVLTETAMTWFGKRNAQTVFLHYVSTNRLSVPFWSKMGFAPYLEVLSFVEKPL
jgi:ribosomal protein S18 acetylase RimI-like enzyme